MSTTNSSARTYVTITPIEGLNLTVNYAFDNKDERRRVYENPEVGDGTAGPGRLNIRNRNFLTQTFNQLITQRLLVSITSKLCQAMRTIATVYNITTV